MTQLSRFIIVGFLSNLILFLLYILFTNNGMGHKTAMTLMYVIGVLQTFFFNKKWSFKSGRNNRTAFTRYAVVYGVAYFVNLYALLIFVDKMGFAHLLVQGCVIVVLAGALFLAQKYWIFSSPLKAKTSQTELD